MADDNHLVEDSFVALVLILSKLLHAEDRAKGRFTTEDSTSRALKFISKERDRILALANISSILFMSAYASVKAAFQLPEVPNSTPD